MVFRNFKNPSFLVASKGMKRLLGYRTPSTSNTTKPFVFCCSVLELGKWLPHVFCVFELFFIEEFWGLFFGVWVWIW